MPGQLAARYTSYSVIVQFSFHLIDNSRNSHFKQSTKINNIMFLYPCRGYIQFAKEFATHFCK